MNVTHTDTEALHMTPEQQDSIVEPGVSDLQWEYLQYSLQQHALSDSRVGISAVLPTTACLVKHVQGSACKVTSFTVISGDRELHSTDWFH